MRWGGPPAGSGEAAGTSPTPAFLSPDVRNAGRPDSADRSSSLGSAAGSSALPPLAQGLSSPSTSGAANSATSAASSAVSSSTGIDGQKLAQAAQQGAQENGASGAASRTLAEAGTQGINAAAAAYGAPAALTEKITRSKPAQKILNGTSKALVAVGAKAVSIVVVLAVLIGVVVVGGVASIMSGGQGYLWNPPTDIAEQNIPAPYLNAYLAAGQKYNVPWTLLAAVGMTASDHGRVDPYQQTPPAYLVTTPAGAASTGSVSDIVVIGDSLTVGAKAALIDQAKTEGLAITIDAAVGATIQEGINGGKEDMIGLKGLPPQTGRGYIVALGTNNFYDSPQTFSGHIDAVMKAVNGAPVVWLTLDFEGDTALNKELVAAQQRHPNLTVADWKAAAQAQGLTKADKFHYTSTGYEARAKFMLANLPGGTPPAVAGAGTTVNVALGASGPGAMTVPDESCPDVERPIAGKPGQGVGPLLLLPGVAAEMGLESDPTKLQNICIAADTLAAAMARVALDTELESRANPADLIEPARGGDMEAINQILEYWTKVMDNVGVAGSTTSVGCAAPPIGNNEQDQWVAHVIDRVWSCLLLDGDPAQRVTKVSFVGTTPEFTIAPDRAQASDAAIREAKAVAWAFSQWGTAKCDNSASVAGVFPLTREQFTQNAGELTSRGRCDPEANITAAANLFLAGERVDPGKRGGAWQALAGGWLNFTGVLGTPEQRKKFLATGPTVGGDVTGECKARAIAGMETLAADVALAGKPVEEKAKALGLLVAQLKVAPECAGPSLPDRAYWVALTQAAPREPGTGPVPGEAAQPTPSASPTTAPTVLDPVQEQLGLLAGIAGQRVDALNPVATKWQETPLVSRLASTPITPRIPTQMEFGLPTGQTQSTQWVNLAVQLGGLYEGDRSLELMQGAYGSSEFGNVGSDVKYAALFNAAGAQYGVDPRLIYAVALQESNATPSINCDTGGAAYGMMQRESVFPDAREVGCGPVEGQINKGAEMLKQLIDIAGDNRGALWGYNNGQNYSEKWKEIGGNWEQAQAYAIEAYSKQDCSQFTGGCYERAIRAMDYIREGEGAASKLPPYGEGAPSAWQTYLHLKEKYPGAVISAVQTSISPGRCPTSLPANVLEDGATVALCAKSVAQASSPEAALAIIWAFNHLGIPYAWPVGVPRSGSSYDCSSFVAGAYHEKDGANLPGVYPYQSTRDMFPWDGMKMAPYYVVIPPGQQRPGDLGLEVSCTSPPCSYQHVVMILADGFQAETNTSSRPSRINAWDGVDAPHFFGIRRVDPSKAR